MSDGSAAAPGTLPATATRFVGRRRELGDVRRLLEEARLVTLTGPGGVGKTRLAVAVADQVRRAFTDGVRFVDLAVVTDGSRVAEVVAAALGIVERSPRPAADKVVDHLRSRNTLVVLDNCEHVLADCAALVDRLLRRTTAVRVLATSRHTTGVDGEHLFAVPPLAVPDLTLPQHAAVTGQFDAVRLLVDRVTAIRPGFEVTDANAEAVARLCIRLDGIPLAIELAATRLRSLSVEQIVERLESRFALLTTGSTAAQPRQQTLRALVDWSHSLCSPGQRLLWSRLSVFSGSFDLEAAEGVCADDEALPTEAVLDVLDHLLAQSIVVAEHDGPTVRFRMLETIRQYGRERLAEAGDVARVTRRHRDHYLGVAERTAARWCGPHQEADLARLRADHDNLRTAMDACAEDDDPTAALRLVVALRNHWYADDFLGEGRRRLDAALARSGPPGGPGAHPPLRARALWVAAWVSLLQGDLGAAAQRLDECERLGAATGDGSAVAHARSLRGTAALFAGDLDAAAAHFQAGIAAMTGDAEGLVWSYFQLAITQVHRGETEAAVATCRTSLRLSEEHGELLCRSYTLWVLGFEAWRRGDAAAGERWVREGLAIQRRFNDAVGVALMISTLTWVAASTGDLDLAAVRAGAAQAAWRTAGTSIAAFGPPLEQHHGPCLERLRAGGRAPVPLPATAGLAHAVAVVLDAAGGGAAASRAAATGVPASRTAPDGSALTARELTVAELVARGLSNRAIAAELVVSPRTVDGHVERILAKLGFTSRTQVAGWVAARAAVRDGG